MSQSLLEQSIFKTLAYFDIADYPLTKEELFAFLWQPPAIGYEEFLEKIEKITIISKYGYYFLNGREEMVEKRRKKLLCSEKKLKLAVKYAKKIRSVPFLRAIFVCNSVGTEQALDRSDIDFFIVTSPKRIWIARFFTNLILRILGRRAYGEKTRDRVCLSFYVDNDNLDLSSLRICESDIHFAYWLNQMLPIYDPDNLYDKFLQANSWTKKYLPNIYPKVKTVSRHLVVDSKIGLIWKNFWEKMWGVDYGNLIEAQAKSFQQVKLKFSIKDKAKADDKGVVLKEGVLKFHENDRRAWYREEWCKKMTNDKLL
jgi:hypothetical protein